MHSIDAYRAASRTHADARSSLLNELKSLGYYDLTPERALILVALTVGEKSVGELMRDAYFGTNVSYNIKQLIDDGYASQGPHPRDLRMKVLRLTRRGREFVERVSSSRASLHANTNAASTAAA